MLDSNATSRLSHDQPALHVFAAATDLATHGMANFLHTAAANRLHATVLSPTAPMGHEVGGRFGIKMQLTTNLINMLHEQDYVLVVDAYDIAFAGDAHDIVQGFKNAVGGRDIVLFGAETGLWPDETLGGLYPPAPSKYKFL